MIHETPGMAVPNAVRGVSTAICISLTGNEGTMVLIFSGPKTAFATLYKRTETEVIKFKAAPAYQGMPFGRLGKCHA